MCKRIHFLTTESWHGNCIYTFTYKGGPSLKLGTILSIVIVLNILLFGCTNSNREQSTKTVHQIPAPSKKLANVDSTLLIATGDMSGVYFLLGKALANLYKKYTDAATGTQVTKASIHNTNLVSKKRAEIGFSTVDVLTLPETKKLKLRALTGLYSNFIQIVTTKKSNIHSLWDLRNKRVSVGTVGSGTKLMSERVLKAANLVKNEMDISYLSFTQSADALRTGTIDAAFFSSGLPNPEIYDLAAEMDITLISIPKQVADVLHHQYEFYDQDQISAQTYKGMAENIETISVKNVLLTYADMPDQTVYQLVKTFYKYLPELKKVHPAVLSIHPEDAMQGIPLQFHPGALQYFKEIKQ